MSIHASRLFFFRPDCFRLHCLVSGAKRLDCTNNPSAVLLRSQKTIKVARASARPRLYPWP